MAVEENDIKTLAELIAHLEQGNILQIADEGVISSYDPKMINNPYVARLQIALVEDERMDDISLKELGNYGPKTAAAVNVAKDSRAGGIFEQITNSGDFVDAEFADTYLTPLMIRQNMQDLNVEEAKDMNLDEQPQDISISSGKASVVERQ